MCGSLLAQTNLNLAANGVTPGSPFTIAPPTTCSFNFFDSGGSTLNYNNGANANVTFLPSNAATHRIQVTFTTFSLEPGYDAFYIYNSNTVGTNQVPGPQGATFAGFPAGNWQNISPGTITASKDLADVGANPTEALTFQFRSDNSISYPGWTAVVRQVTKDPCAMTAPAAQTLKADSFVHTNSHPPLRLQYHTLRGLSLNRAAPLLRKKFMKAITGPATPKISLTFEREMSDPRLQWQATHNCTKLRWA